MGSLLNVCVVGMSSNAYCGLPHHARCLARCVSHVISPALSLRPDVQICRLLCTGFQIGIVEV